MQAWLCILMCGRGISPTGRAWESWGWAGTAGRDLATSAGPVMPVPQHCPASWWKLGGVHEGQHRHRNLFRGSGGLYESILRSHIPGGKVVERVFSRTPPLPRPGVMLLLCPHLCEHPRWPLLIPLVLLPQNTAELHPGTNASPPA